MELINLETYIKIIRHIQENKYYNLTLYSIYTFGFILFFKNISKKTLENKKYYNIHLGKRCFILGNGPSLNNVEFSTLENEYIFTVNRLMLHSEFRKLHSNYHIWMDPAGFEMEVYLDEMKSLRELGNPILFVPSYTLDYCKTTGLDTTLNISYITALNPRIHSKWIQTDISKVIPSAINVIHHAIICACYMGFKEIYLLGCDATLMNDAFKKLLNEQAEPLHCYGTTEEESHTTTKVIESGSFPESLSCYTEMFYAYKYIHEYCVMNGIKLVNLSEKTLIDSIPRDKFENIITQLSSELSPI